MALKTKIGKADYEALSEELKKEYVADGEGYKLDADYEDVTGLKNKNEELLKKLVEFKKFDGLDPEAAREALAKLSELEDGQLLKKQQFDELFNKKKGEWDKEKESLENKIKSMFERTATQSLSSILAKNGVKPHLADDLALIVRQQIDPFEEGGSPVWKTKDGLETVDLDKYIPSLKESKADYFASSMGSGSGASGSGNNGGNAKTMPKSQWDALGPKEQAAAIKSGITPVE